MKLIPDDIFGVLFSIGMYFVIIELGSWIMGSIFYHFENIPNFFIYGYYFKGLFTLFTMFIVYAFATFCINSNDESSSTILLLILILLIADDISDVNTLGDIFPVLLASWEDLFKILLLLFLPKE